MNGRRIKKGVVAIAAAAVMAAPAAPATAAPADSDCIIMGPHYVAEIVDCAIYIATRPIT